MTEINNEIKLNLKFLNVATLHYYDKPVDFYAFMENLKMQRCA